MSGKSVGSTYWWAAFVASIVVSMGYLAGCETLQVGSDYDPNATFRNLHTFTLMQREHRGIHNPLVAVRAADAIKADLEQKGYVEASDPQQADFIVDFTVGSKERTDVTSYPEPYGLAWGGGPGWWGGPYWGDTVDVHQYREGTLSVDVFDAHNHRPVWHGWAKKELSEDDIAHSAGPIQTAVASILARFPPGPNAG